MMPPGFLLARQTPRFELISIRPVPPGTPTIMRAQDFTPVLPGGQYIDARTNLLFLITFADDVKNPSFRLVGLPKWAASQEYAIAAKASDAFSAPSPKENREQVRVMLRALLADRFQLQLHTGMRKSAIFNLEVTKGGLQIKEADPPVPPEKEGPVGAAMGDRRGRMLGRKSTMAGIAEALALFLTRPVTDGTGLKGYYDFDIKWTASSTAEPSPPFDGFGSEGEALIAANEGNRSGRTLDRRPRRTSLLQLTQYSYPIEAVPNPRICGQL